MDTVTYDMSQLSESTPSFFVKKDYLSILDNSNGIYSSNQIIIDTSQLSNSNKWINYREGYLLMPLLVSMTSPNTATGLALATSTDFSISLKNWYGTIIHSISLDLQGSTIIQQTPFQSLWNTFKLMTTLSYQSLVTESATIGFYPDSSNSFSFNSVVTAGGIGVCNNSNLFVAPPVAGDITTSKRDSFNKGFYERQRVWNFAYNQSVGLLSATPTYVTNSALLSQANTSAIYKSNIIKKVPSAAGGAFGVWQCAIQAVVYLRHLHSFFDKMPLMKGIFFRLTLNINNSSSVVTYSAAGGSQTLKSVTCPLGGVNPLMIASSLANNGSSAKTAGDYYYNISVGAICLDSTIKAVAGIVDGPNRNVTLNVPAYTFNPVFENAYISNSVRKIEYEDIYQYQVLKVGKQTGMFNQLITNGISGIKSVLVLPFFSAAENGGVAPIQSPYDPSGGGTTSPLCMLNNFNVVISGMNTLYNSERYTYEQFIQQLNGQNAINGNLVDGIGSSLISQLDFENSYCYYYVDVSRCLPIEVGVSKSVNIIGQNISEKEIDLYVFISYSCSVTVDALLGQRL